MRSVDDMLCESKGLFLVAPVDEFAPVAPGFIMFLFMVGQTRGLSFDSGG